MSRGPHFSLTFAAVAALLLLCVTAAQARTLSLDTPGSPIPGPTWATPVNPAINLYRMTPTLYRSALPSRGDLPQLNGLGVRTVISFIKDDDREWLGDSPLERVSIPLHADRVSDDDVLQVMRVVQQAEGRGPVLMHCKHGRDRTGLMAAMYRILLQGWSRDQALEEMRAGGFGDPMDMEDAIAYVNRADIDGLRQALSSGACSTRALATCQVGQWWRQTFGLAREDATTVQ